MSSPPDEFLLTRTLFTHTIIQAKNSEMFGQSLLLLLLSLLLMMRTVAARGAGGGSTGGSRSGTALTSSNNNGGSYKYALKPIVATTFFSDVILAQTTRGSRSRSTTTTINNRTDYTLLAAPVYSYGYSFHGGFLVIPDGRALRIRSQTERVTDASGNACTHQNQTTVTLYTNTNDFFAQAILTVDYGEGLSSENKTYSSKIELEEKAIGRNVTVNCTSTYNRAIVPGTNCSRIETRIEATLVSIVSQEFGLVIPLWAHVVIVLAMILMVPSVALLSQHVFCKCK